jgi:hypothetical protein
MGGWLVPHISRHGQRLGSKHKEPSGRNHLVEKNKEKQKYGKDMEQVTRQSTPTPDDY